MKYNWVGQWTATKESNMYCYSVSFLTHCYFSVMQLLHVTWELVRHAVTDLPAPLHLQNWNPHFNKLSWCFPHQFTWPEIVNKHVSEWIYLPYICTLFYAFTALAHVTSCLTTLMCLCSLCSNSNYWPKGQVTNSKKPVSATHSRSNLTLLLAQSSLARDSITTAL